MTTLDKLARAMHDAYEDAAKREGWATQESCRVEFDDLPDANKRTMYATARAVLDALEEPDEGMIEAALDEHARGQPWESPFGPDGHFACMYRAMIQRAKGE